MCPHSFARYYNSSLGRFMSVDQAPGDITAPQTLNRYAYVGNNPLNATDPSGLDCQGLDGGDCGGISIGIGFGWDLGGGDGGGGGRPVGHPGPLESGPMGSSPNPPNGTLTSDDPFSGETNGIPNGLQVPTLGLPGILGFPTCDFGGCGVISDYHNGGYAVGDYNDEVLCTDSPSSCVVWSASAGMWSPDPATACWGGDALCTPGGGPASTRRHQQRQY
jgi:hypothetical protein